MDELENAAGTMTQTWPIPDDEAETLTRMLRMELGFDTARLSSPLGQGLFLIVGSNRNSRDDQAIFVDQDGNRLEFEYVDESCVAAGRTVNELVKSARDHARMRETTWEEFFDQLIEKEGKKENEDI
jgi:hypothetical protein